MKFRKILFFILVIVSFLGGFAGRDRKVPRASFSGPPRSAAQLIEALETSYAGMDLERYGSLFADPKRHGVAFHFVLDRLTADGQKEWGYGEEMRIHRRMFRPGSVGPGERPLQRGLAVRSIDCELIPLQKFTERWDLYRSEQNPSGPLDRHRWRATDAVYSTAVTWFTEGGELGIRGQARFVVIEDLRLSRGEAGKFLIYQWEDFGTGFAGRLMP